MAKQTMASPSLRKATCVCPIFAWIQPSLPPMRSILTTEPSIANGSRFFRPCSCPSGSCLVPPWTEQTSTLNARVQGRDDLSSK